MKLLNQVTNHKDLVNVAMVENLDKKMWKHQNKKELNKAVEEYKKMTLQAIVELPDFEAYVRKFEMKLGKHRSKFNVLEREQVDRTYHELNRGN